MDAQQFAAVLEGMRQMVQSATDATRQLADATQRAQPTNPGGSNDSWSRILPRPAVFSPSNKDDELTNFPDWKWQFQQYVNGVCPDIGELMVSVEEHIGEVIPMRSLSIEKQAQSGRLYALLGSLMRGRAGQIIRAIKDNNGFEAWREIVSTLSPESKTRSLALLGAITQYPSVFQRQYHGAGLEV